MYVASHVCSLCYCYPIFNKNHKLEKQLAVTAGQYYWYPGYVVIPHHAVYHAVSWCHYVPYQVSKLELFIIFEASKGQNHMTRTQSNKKSADISTLHVYNISYIHCNVRCEMHWLYVGNISTILYVAWISWYTNFSRYCPTLLEIKGSFFLSQMLYTDHG